jgi:hypothetical protein
VSFADKMMAFIANLEFDVSLPHDIKVMHPFKEEKVLSICDQFYHKFYHDQHKRYIILGINPGRFGGGITGIPFTDPIRLQIDCGIENDLQKKQELSSVFIYQMIKACGGVQQFYSQFYFSAMSPLGFTRNNKNLNYYDDKELLINIKPFIIGCIEQQLEFGIHTHIAFCLGDGKNYSYLKKLNEEMNLFEKIISLPHPRFIMQYRLKKKEEYVDLYRHWLQSVN